MLSALQVLGFLSVLCCAMQTNAKASNPSSYVNVLVKKMLKEKQQNEDAEEEHEDDTNCEAEEEQISEKPTTLQTILRSYWLRQCNSIAQLNKLTSIQAVFEDGENYQQGQQLRTEGQDIVADFLCLLEEQQLAETLIKGSCEELDLWATSEGRSINQAASDYYELTKTGRLTTEYSEALFDKPNQIFPSQTFADQPTAVLKVACRSNEGFNETRPWTNNAARSAFDERVKNTSVKMKVCCDKIPDHTGILEKKVTPSSWIPLLQKYVEQAGIGGQAFKALAEKCPGLRGILAANPGLFHQYKDYCANKASSSGLKDTREEQPKCPYMNGMMARGMPARGRVHPLGSDLDSARS